MREANQPRARCSTDILINPDQFDNKTQRVKKGAGNSMKLNSELRTIYDEIQKLILDNPSTSPKGIAALIKHGSSENFIDFVKEELKIDGRGGIAPRTYVAYVDSFKVVERLWGSHVKFSYLIPENLRLLEYEMKSNGYSINYIKQVFKVLRKYTRRASQMNKIKFNPFEEYKVGSFVDAEKEWNTPEEIEKLKGLVSRIDEIPERLRSTLVHYLHSCHCGLRMIDSRRFDPEKHVDGDFIVIMPSKGESRKSMKLRIPLNEYARSLHAIMQNQNALKSKTSRVSKDLKEICEIVGIKKHITFHCSRHSFAINSLINGIPIEVVSKWLDHGSIATTQIYARIVDSLSRREMQKWENRDERTTLIFRKSPKGQYSIQLPEFGFESMISFGSINEAKLYLFNALNNS